MSKTTQGIACKHGELNSAAVRSEQDGSDSESSKSDPSDMNEDVIRLVNSTRKLLRSSSQEQPNPDDSEFVQFGSREQLWHPKSCLNVRYSNPIQLETMDNTESSCMNNDSANIFSKTIIQKPISLQNLSTNTGSSYVQCTLQDPMWEVCRQHRVRDQLCTALKQSDSVKQPNTETPNLVKSDDATHKLESDSSRTTLSNICHVAGSTSDKKLDSSLFNSPIPDLPPGLVTTRYNNGSTSGSVFMRRTKIGLPFFRAKQTSPNQSKSVQMKELKRMIRAGKPSYEQIHSWGHSFETLLNDRFGLALFKDFLSTEFSDENIEFWIACQEYKQITNPKKLTARAQRIFAEYIAVQANREVNLDSKTRLQTEADLAHPTIHTLDNAQKRIQALMEKDSYRRFLRSEVYMTLYSEAREVAKAAAASALAASLQQASDELDGAVLHLVNTTSSNSPFSFLSNLSSGFASSPGPGLHLPGVAAAAASAEAGMNNVQDLQLLGLSTSRHMRHMQAASTSGGAKTSPRARSDVSGSMRLSSTSNSVSSNTKSSPTHSASGSTEIGENQITADFN